MPLRSGAEYQPIYGYGFDFTQPTSQAFSVAATVAADAAAGWTDNILRGIADSVSDTVLALASAAVEYYVNAPKPVQKAYDDYGRTEQQFLEAAKRWGPRVSDDDWLAGVEARREAREDRVRRPDPQSIEQLVDPDKCPPGQICEDFQFDMAQNSLTRERQFERAVEISRQQEQIAHDVMLAVDLTSDKTLVSTILDFARGFSDTVTIVADWFRKNEPDEPEKERKNKATRVAHPLLLLLGARKHPTETYVMRDFFGPSKTRYRKSGYFRPSATGAPYL